MRALVFEQAGPAVDVLSYRDVPMRPPTTGEILVRVTARPIDPADLMFIAGRYRIAPTFPQIAGLQAAGVVAHAEAGQRFALGQRVAFRWPGTWASQVCVPSERLIAIPDDIDDRRACQIALNPLTALGLLDVAEAKAGDTILLTAATSSVANIVGSIARTRGIRTIGVVRGDAEADRPRCTTDVVVSSRDADFLDQICAGGDAPGILLDSVGGAQAADLMGLLSPGATIVAYGVQDPAVVPVTNATLIYRNLTWHGFGIDRWLQGRSTEDISQLLVPIWDLIRRQKMELAVASVHGLEDFRAAIEAHDRPRRKGSILFVTTS